MKLFEVRRIHAVNDEGQDAGPYLWRLTIVEAFGWSLKLHYFYRGDEDRDLHDHPWSFVSLILWGGYWEHSPANPRAVASIGGRPANPVAQPFAAPWYRETRRSWHRPLSVLWRPAPSPHRIEIEPGKHAVTLLLMWPKSRPWGFYTVCGWVPFTKYAQTKQEGC